MIENRTRGRNLEEFRDGGKGSEKGGRGKVGRLGLDGPLTTAIVGVL